MYAKTSVGFIYESLEALISKFYYIFISVERSGMIGISLFRKKLSEQKCVHVRYRKTQINKSDTLGYYYNHYCFYTQIISIIFPLEFTMVTNGKLSQQIMLKIWIGYSHNGFQTL